MLLIAYYLDYRDEVDAYLETVRDSESRVIEEIKSRSPFPEIRDRLLARKRLSA